MTSGLGLLRKNKFWASHPIGGVSSLHSKTLKGHLGDPNICMEEINLFRAMMQWVNIPNMHKGKDSWTAQILLQRHRKAAKKLIAKCIDLSKIAPSDLMGTVRESGLVNEADISNALIQVALHDEKECVSVSKSHSNSTMSLPFPPERVIWKPPQTCHGLTIEEEDNSVITDIFVDEDANS